MSNYPDDALQSKALFERAKQSLPGGNTRTTVFMKPFPIYATHGRGFQVWDATALPGSTASTISLPASTAMPIPP